jgi:hypothetical protein
MKAMLNEKVTGFQFPSGDLEFCTIATKYKMALRHIQASNVVNMWTPYSE